jgi:hypothetical protein
MSNVFGYGKEQYGLRVERHDTQRYMILTRYDTEHDMT